MILNNNINFLSNLYKTQRSIDKVASQLSTGLRVNKAADDPSSVIYSTRLTTKINEKESQLLGTKKAQFILESMQVGFASLQRVVTEIKKVAQSATNPLLSPDELSSLSDAYYKLAATYDDITKNFEVDKVNYLYDDEKVFVVNTGYEKIEIRSAAVGNSQYGGISYLMDFLPNAEFIANDISDDHTNILSNIQAKYARIQNSLERYEELNMNQLAIMKKDYSRIMDVDTAKATSELARLQILEENNLMLMQVNDSTNQLFKTLMEF